MPEESPDLAKIANVLGLLLTREMNRSAAVATLRSCGFSTREIAGLIGSTEGSVRAMLSQSRKKVAGERSTKDSDG
jgi:DNA-directed RNA polymerase specialized sigma24 family protein